MKELRWYRNTLLVATVLFSHTLVLGQVTKHVYSIPFASKDNTIELGISNESPISASDIIVKPKDVPSWIKISPSERVISKLSDGEEAIVLFTFSVEHSAPVNSEQTLRFDVLSPTGEIWAKEISISVTQPQRYELLQNFPNPFNPETKIEYTLPDKVLVRLVVFNVIGQEVQSLVAQEEEPGYKSVSFNASNLPSGMYFYRLQAGNYVETKKMMLMK